MMWRVVLVMMGILTGQELMAWGFFAHRMINRHAVFMLPPEMMILYKPAIGELTELSVNPDKRRYILPAEGPRHYIDLDKYKDWDSIPASYQRAVEKYGEDSLMRHGIVPWWIQIMMSRLTKAFEEKNATLIIKLSAELGHYISDAHVPLHACSNHNGQFTNQHGIHGFWESRIPELFAATTFDLLLGKASYIPAISPFAWRVVRQSAAAADTVLSTERLLAMNTRADLKYSFEMRNGQVIRQYSTYYSKQYHLQLKGMVERRMRASIQATASLWYTAWINAGQPDLRDIAGKSFSEAELTEWEELNKQWKALGMPASSCSN
jgi:hypothetical protein